MHVVLALLEWIAGHPLAPRVDGVPVSLAHGPSQDRFIHAAASLSHTPPASPKCVLTPPQSTPLHSTASAFFCLVFFVHLHPSVARNLKTSLIFRKRSEPEPTPSPDPAAPQAARDLASRRYSHSRRVQARRLIDLNAPNSVSTPQSGGARSALSASYDSDGTMPGLVSTSDDDSDLEDFRPRPNSLQSRSQGASTTPSAGHVRRGAPNERSREEEDEAHVQCGQRQGNMLFEQLQPSTRSMLCWHTVQVYPDAT